MNTHLQTELHEIVSCCCEDTLLSVYIEQLKVGISKAHAQVVNLTRFKNLLFSKSFWKFNIRVKPQAAM